MAHASDLVAAELGPGTPQRRFRAEEVRRMVEQGILYEDDRVELVAGILIAAEPQSTYHNGPLQLLAERFMRGVDPQGWMVRIQMAVAVDEYSEPEPDLSVVP